jgi:hypothetical protein
MAAAGFGHEHRLVDPLDGRFHARIMPQSVIVV